MSMTATDQLTDTFTALKEAADTALANQCSDEFSTFEKYVSEDVAAWHRDMGRYLRSIDPYNHLITTSWAGIKGDPAVDGLPEMDYIQSHQYGAPSNSSE